MVQSYLEIGEGFGKREMSEEEKVRKVVLLPAYDLMWLPAGGWLLRLVLVPRFHPGSTGRLQLHGDF